MEEFMLILELVGIVAFASSGVFIGVKSRLDAFGVCVLGVITSLGGGFLRDLTLGVIPPVMFVDRIYGVTALIVSIVMFIYLKLDKEPLKTIDRLTGVVNIPDTIGLGIFTVVGAQHAIAAGYGENAFLVIFIGTVTGVGGGVFRDVLTASVPYILRKHVYALASFAGAVIYYIFYYYGLYDWALFCGAMSVIVIRTCASIWKWDLPRAF